MMHPTARLLRFVTLWSLTAGLPVLARLFLPELFVDALLLWLLPGAVLLAVLVIDLWLARRLPPIQAERLLPAALSVQQQHGIRLRFDSSTLPDHFDVADRHPADDSQTGLPARVQRQDAPVTEFRYPYRPSQRGVARFGDIEIWRSSPLGLLMCRHTIAAEHTVPVYPDFSVLQRDALHAHQDSRLDPGSRKQPRRGEGFEFHQLREYLSGDSLRQIDWKASARRRKLISREYQEEQNQQLIILLDGGERLAMSVNGLTGFDHALNATLLLTWSALKHRDKPGVMLFSNDTPCWIPPVRGHQGANLILSKLYALQPGRNASDYSAAARALATRWKKHSLVVLITRVQPDDEEELMSAIALLSRRHRVLIADIQLPEQAALEQREVVTPDDAFMVAGDALWQESRRALYARLRHAGALITSASPDTLPARLNQVYLSLKRAGSL